LKIDIGMQGLRRGGGEGRGNGVGEKGKKGGEYLFPRKRFCRQRGLLSRWGKGKGTETKVSWETRREGRRLKD